MSPIQRIVEVPSTFLSYFYEEMIIINLFVRYMHLLYRYIINW